MLPILMRGKVRIAGERRGVDFGRISRTFAVGFGQSASGRMKGTEGGQRALVGVYCYN
jgi:hypothetical protein